MRSGLILDGEVLTDENSTYLGDGVYGVNLGAGRVLLVTTDGLQILQRMCIDDIRESLAQWLAGLKNHA